MSEETKNPLIESFLHLHERITKDKNGNIVGGLLGPNFNTNLQGSQNLLDKALAQQSANKALGTSFGSMSPAPQSGVKIALPGPSPAPAAAPPNPTLGSENMRFSSGSLTGPGPIKTGNPIDVAPKIDNSASMNRAKTDYQTRVAGVERQNPILSPGKLEGGNLQMGSRGDSVKELQRKLGIKDDGIFGKDTAAALKAFQQKNNLKVDAIYGRQSASAMNKQSGMNNLKKENPVGAYVSSQTVKPMSPMAGQGSSKNIARPSANISTLKRTGPMPISGNQGNFYTPVKSGSDLDRIANSDTTFIQNNKPIGSQTPMGALTKLAGQNAVERLKQQRLNQSYEEPEMTNKLIEAFMQLHSTNSPNLFAEAKKAKKLDPVGKEDEDIDNDGDKDKSDSYLHNRRKAIKAAMKEAASVKVDPYSDGMTPREMGLPPPGTEKKVKPGNSKVIQTGPNSSTVTKSTNEEVEDDDDFFKPHQKSAMNNAKRLYTSGHLSKPGQTVGQPFLSGNKHVVVPVKNNNGQITHHYHEYDHKDGYVPPQASMSKPSSLFTEMSEEVEQLDEALTAAHKAAIAKHVGKMWGKKGNISFNKEGGKHFVSHSDGIETHVHSIDMKKGVPHVTHFMTMQESAEQLDELKKAALMAVRNRASGRMMDDPHDEKSAKVERQASKRLKKISDAEKEESSKRAYKAYKEDVEQIDENDIDESIAGLVAGTAMGALAGYGGMKSNLIPRGVEKAASMMKKLKKKIKPVKEDVEFSEAEIAHIAAILEANPIAPVPYEYSGAANGVSFRDLSDETVAEEEMKRGRGRPKGSKSGSKHGAGGDSTVETKNLASQIRFSRPSGGNFMLKHPTTGVTKAVPAKAATEFYNKYSNAEKPAQKQAHHDEFLAKHFGSSEKPKTGITLPKIPAPKS